ncbi:MAG: hybrid sensor histidine kinase/response regulator [Sphingobacteriaceae bacterium]
MKYRYYRSMFNGVKGKVIIAFLLACIALSLAWTVSRVAFSKMLQTVEIIATPNDRLRLVNDLSRSMIQLDQMQRTKGIKFQDKSDHAFLKESRKLRLGMDTLNSFYQNNPQVSKRIDSMKKLLKQRDKLFMNYLEVRKGLVSNKIFSDQIQELNGIISNSSRQTDSTLITTKKTVSTMTFYPLEPDSKTNKKSSKGFLNRIFGKQEQEKITATVPNQVINEELKIEVDTAALAKKDRVMRQVSKTMGEMAVKRRRQSIKFITQEAQLAEAGSISITQMLAILQQVEKEVVKQVEQNNNEAKMVIDNGIKRIGLIIIGFFLLIIILLFLILTDIAKSAKYRRELELAKEEAEYHGMAKQRFLANMSHEIRTPLQSIIGYAELVNQQPHAQKKELDAIYQSSTHLLQIVNEVLDYSRIISGKFTFEEKDFNIREILEEAILVMRPQAVKKSLELITTLTIEDCEWIKGDPFRLKQIIFNLLSNAVKFTDTGKVTLTASCKSNHGKNHFKFTVEDTGCGIPENTVHQIFEAFEHQNTAFENNHNNTGLGLSIAKALIETQGGRIYVESKPGKGSCFTFYINYQSAEQQLPKTTNQINSAIKLPYVGKVWIVDDDRFILELCGTLLHKNGIKYRSFSSPEEVLNTPWDEAVNCILLDMRMPVMNGSELLSILRKKVPPIVKIYALTAQVLPDEREAFLLRGFDGLLMKPFRHSELLNLIYQSKPNPVFNKTKDIQLDLSAVEKMTFGDPLQLNKIVKRFIIDSTEDLQELQMAQNEINQERKLLLLHRIAGRTAQLGSKDLASKFRALEIALAEKGELDEVQQKEVNVCMALLTRLTNQLKEMLVIQSDTSPSYYTASSDQY